MDKISVTAFERAAVAAKCGVVDAYLYQIFTRRKMAGAALCVAIERATGGSISRKHLRPDDWHLIWPELACGHGSQASQLTTSPSGPGVMHV